MRKNFMELGIMIFVVALILFSATPTNTIAGDTQYTTVQEFKWDGQNTTVTNKTWLYSDFVDYTEEVNAAMNGKGSKSKRVEDTFDVLQDYGFVPETETFESFQVYVETTLNETLEEYHLTIEGIDVGFPTFGSTAVLAGIWGTVPAYFEGGWEFDDLFRYVRVYRSDNGGTFHMLSLFVELHLYPEDIEELYHFWTNNFFGAFWPPLKYGHDRPHYMERIFAGVAGGLIYDIH